MEIKDGQIALCPRDPAHVEFSSTAHVAETWRIDKEGEFISLLQGEGETTHHAREFSDTWSCIECGSAPVFVDPDEWESVPEDKRDLYLDEKVTQRDEE